MNLTHLLCCQCNVFGNRRSFLFLFNFLGSTQVTALMHSPLSLLQAPRCEQRVRHCGEQDSPVSSRCTALRLLCTGAVDFHGQHDISSEAQNVRAGEDVSSCHVASLSAHWGPWAPEKGTDLPEVPFLVRAWGELQSIPSNQVFFHLWLISFNPYYQ